MNGRGSARVSSGVIIMVLVALLAGAVLLQYSIDNGTTSSAGWDESSPFDTARSVLNVLGGIRETLAAYMWTKTDVVFHEYLGGSVTNENSLFPYFWLITRLDPHFTMAYYFASWMLARLGHVDQGFDLALEGLRYNPYSAVLQDNLASMYFYFKKDPKKARYHILKAIELTRDAGDREVYRTFLRAIDQVLAGKKTITEVVPLQHTNKLNEELEQQEQQHQR